MKIICNNQELELNENSSGADIAKALNIDLKSVIAYKHNGVIYDLYSPITSEGEIELILNSNEEAKDILNHSTAHLLAEAVLDIFKDAKLAIGPSIENGFYYDIDFGSTILKEEDLTKIEKKMKEFSKKNFYIKKEVISKEKALEKIQAYDLPHNQIAKVSCKKRWYARCANPRFNVVAIDCGIKYNIIRDLNRNGCNVTIVPYNTSAKEILALKPDGIFLSNGPGDPQDVKEIVEVIKELQGIKPLFGICLGHQLIALANGFDTYKLKFGHRGANHPVLNIVTGKIEITSQNHSYAVKEKEDPNVKITHYNLLDKTVEGLEIAKDCCFSVQYHPESAAGPEDSKYLFKKFIDYMEQVKEKDNA